MTDLVEFLRARLDEEAADAQAAQAESGPDWDPGNEHLGESVNEAEVSAPVVVGPYGYLDWNIRRHIARHAPARVLREVEAKRALIEDLGCYGGPETADAYDVALRHLALPYADHPDYDPDWRPSAPS